MKILIAADFYPVRRAEEKMRAKEYDYLLGEVRPFIEKADYSIVNYESTFWGDKKGITKYGPNMATDEQSVDLALWCGFNCSTLANNHVHDYGDKGLNDMLQYMKNHNMDYVGAGMNLKDASKTLYKEICGETVAFINCCEHEFNIANEEHGGANPLNVVQQYYAIGDAKMKANKVIVIVHGGSINCQLPSPRMQEQYRFFVDCGADAVINHHQHCFSGYEYYRNAPIVYGLGNFLFDKPWLKNTTWTEGYMCELDFYDKAQRKVHISLLPYTQCSDEPRVIMMKDRKKDLFFEEINEINKIIESPDLLSQEYTKWIDKNEDECIKALAAIQNKYIVALQRRKLFPQIYSESMHLLNYCYCESHLDRLVRYLKKRNNIQ